MDRKEIRNTLFPECPVRNILSKILDKWSLLVLYTLEQAGMMRFNDLRRAIPDISQKMLTTTLKSLEMDGLVSRKVIPDVPVKVEYRLTDRSLQLMPMLDVLLGWAIENFGPIVNDREKYHQQ